MRESSPPVFLDLLGFVALAALVLVFLVWGLALLAGDAARWVWRMARNKATTAAAAAALATLAPGSVAAALGVPGAGKTTAAQEARPMWGRSLVFDPGAERDRLEWNRGKRERTPWAGGLVTVDDLLEFPQLLDDVPLSLVVSSGEWSARGIGGDFATLIRLAWLTGDVVIVGEECGSYSRECVEAIHRVATRGGHAGIALVLIAQSIGRIHADGRREIDLVVAGAQGEPNDLDDLRGRCGASFVEKVKASKRGDPLHIWRLGDGVEGKNS